MKNINGLAFTVLFILIIGFTNTGYCDDYDFSVMENSFKNFVTCELTRTDADDHFKGKPFTITMIDLFDVAEESGMKIVSGAVECFVGNSHKTLYVAVGLKETLGKWQPGYYVIRKSDFSILATEILKYPYKERCKWGAYRIDID